MENTQASTSSLPPIEAAAADKDQELDELDDGYDTDSSENVNSFKIRNPLNPPSAKIFSTAQLHELIHDGVIDLNPPYQRDVVWPESKQVGLIDSVFRNFYIPPVVFAVRKDEEGEEIRICVDGKQRLTSIQKFFDGQIPHRDVKTKKNYYYVLPENNKTSRLEVPEAYKQQFATKQITCVEYLDLSPAMERDIFQRVQLGMTLTAAEKLQAISSPWAEWISDLESRHVSVEGGLSELLEWDTKRGRNFQNIAHLVYCCDGVEEEALPTAQKIEKWLVRVDKPGDQFKSDIDIVLRQLWNIASSPALSTAFRSIGKRLAPVEFIFIGVLLYVLRTENIQNQATAIHSLRQGIRAQYQDIRNNSTVGKSLWELVKRLRANPTGQLAGSGHTKVEKGRKKRKLSPTDEEYRPQPVRHLTKGLKTRAAKQLKGS
ncbi:hypothetical protein BDN72DRAFT_831277 [Pluteus cervinus]|uniref:Uncharacterized protein n=1 Tax=Pluteus cervinus TaxID=181527 RepID=A0ACD3BBX1_9AGAR|nr:hypothetical protein BDN72DRAFT_831277 [Pluteus cervinus]